MDDGRGEVREIPSILILNSSNVVQYTFRKEDCHVNEPFGYFFTPMKQTKPKPKRKNVDGSGTGEDVLILVSDAVPCMLPYVHMSVY